MKSRFTACVVLFSTLSIVAVGARTLLAEPGRADADVGRDRARQMIQQRLRTLDRQKSRLMRALERLDTGDSLESIKAELGEGVDGLRQDDNRPGDIAPEERRQRVLEVLDAINPELFRRLRRLSRENPERANQTLDRISKEGRVRELLTLQRKNPQQFRQRVKQWALERQATKAAREFADAAARGDDGAAREARQAVRALISQQLDLRFEEERRSMNLAEERLSSLRDKLDEHESQRDKLIDDRVEALLRRTMNLPRGRRANPARQNHN